MSDEQRPFLKAVLDHPRVVHGALAILTVSLFVLAALPSVWKPAASVLSPLTVDTDPENMLDEDVPVRVFHRAMKERFHIYDMVVVGVENEEHPEGVFNVETLAHIHDLTEYAKTLRWPVEGEEEGAFRGVVDHELLAPSTVDNIEPGDLGSVRFSWLMGAPPTTEDEALAIRDAARRLPMLDGTLVSEDGKALALYLPLTEKDVAHKVSKALEERYSTYGGHEKFHVTGLPVAEDTFGIEMFIQMAISAPVAMLVIAILLFVFFRRAMLVLPPLFVAFVTVVQTMGLLVVCGQTIHIMSSMIPIFIMPIAVLDAIHIISEFFDRQREDGDRRQIVLGVMNTLWRPMLFTSLTTAAGFASLALTPIPPVQVFGVFVAIGVLLAWFWTMTFIPVLLATLPAHLVMSKDERPAEQRSTLLTRGLEGFGRFTAVRGKLILVFAAACAVLAVYGISKIRVNDNPTMWFESNHPIRVADRMLNSHFGGTYMAHLVLEPSADADDADAATLTALRENAAAAGEDQALANAYQRAAGELERLIAESSPNALAELEGFADRRAEAAEGDDWPAWEEVTLFVGTQQAALRVFEQPEALREVVALQEHLLGVTADDGHELVGKSTSLADIVQTVHRELYQSDPEAYRIPDSQAAVAQTLLTFQSSHRPRDLQHFVSPDAGATCLWIQLKSGDNQDMIDVVAAVDDYLENNQSELALRPQWFGLTYINMVWQEEMVAGMANALLGSFAIVLVMMILLFRSFWWGLLSMIPLTLTIALIYGIIGLIGKDYDMPVTVLSSLSLGLAVDYAIHFLERSRAAHQPGMSWSECVAGLFEEPARAIARNAIVVGLGFLPLLLAPLVPYQTVGALIAVILLTAGFASLGVLPAMIGVMERLLFRSAPAPDKD